MYQFPKADSSLAFKVPLNLYMHNRKLPSIVNVEFVIIDEVQI